MVVKIPGTGFCAGVQSAIIKADEQQRMIEMGKNVYIYGNLINNDSVMRDYASRGYIITEDLNTIMPGSLVIIRAHGVAKYVYDALTRKNTHIIDCTCPKVIKIHEIVSHKSEDGYRIIIVGKKGHPEVEGTVGWCMDGAVSVVENKADLDGAEAGIGLTGEICVIAQTTCKREIWEDVTGYILSVNEKADIIDTLCSVTGRRERDAKEVSESADAMVVIGGKKSSNSIELYDVCKSSCKNTIFVESLAELIESMEWSGIKMPAVSVIGIAGSASTPSRVIDEICGYLSFLELLAEAKNEIEEMTSDYFARSISEAGDNLFIIDALNALQNQNKGGKRIRGAVIKLGELIASRGAGDNYLPIAVGFEIFQTAILIHDDIIDRSEMRRGKPTIHVETAHALIAKNDHPASILSAHDSIPAAEAEHFGVSKALSIGDYAFFIAYQLLSECKIGGEELAMIYKVYSQVLSKTCEGEIMDVALPYGDISIVDDYDEYCRCVTQIYEYKTAWYTLAGPIMLGAICGGAGDELIGLLKNIMTPLGVAFQIKDDLLGIYSGEKTLGKSILSDIQENKQTLLYGYAFKNADNRERELLNKHYGKIDAGEYDLDIVRQIFDSTGAKQYAEREIIRLSEISEKLIGNPLIDNQYKPILYGLANYLKHRTK